ncbi:MAG TPA: phospholipase D-like domain-containing protein [Candidatus Baltobacteraceae bacterium]|nr:phospholipase D-like domain-containing protein [Candidatus Baltobacteraceae bacterium]
MSGTLLALAIAAAAASPTLYCQPGGNTAYQLEALCRSATASIDVAAYELTSPALAANLVAAKTRGLTVRVVLDAYTARDTASKKDELATAGVGVYLDGSHRAMHSKYAVFDGVNWELGSYNWSMNAEQANAEATLAGNDAAVAAGLEANFASLLAESAPYRGPPAAAAACPNGRCPLQSTPCPNCYNNSVTSAPLVLWPQSSFGALSPGNARWPPASTPCRIGLLKRWRRP